jgi:NAD(P)-dependent dehydrogenase (short-subunit alcohol dehydrogenase family)
MSQCHGNAIVTGAGRNIGKAIALELAMSGMGVALVDLDPAALAQTREEIAEVAPGIPVSTTVCDVASPGDVSAMADQVVAELGSIYALVNNVAITDRGATILDLPPGEWRRVLDTTLTSAFLCSQQVAKQLVRQGSGGVIINIGSTSGYLGRGNAIAYPTAKSALIGFTRSMALQLGRHGIRVNLVAPNKAGSPVGQAERTPDRKISNLVGRPAEPEDIARTVRFLISDDAGFIDGVDLLVDGGAVLAAGAD